MSLVCSDLRVGGCWFRLCAEEFGISSVGQRVSEALLVSAWLDQNASGCAAVFGAGSKAFRV